MRENLDPLRQKPDFQKLAAQRYSDAHLEYRRCCVDGMSSIWYSHVEPLMKELDAKDKEMEGLIDIHHLQDEDLKERFEEKESRIRELEEDRDKFAIGFPEWILMNGWEPIESGRMWTKFGYTVMTTANLLELYKESLLNQKP